MARRGKALEDEYFHRKEKELIEKLRQKKAREEQLKELSEATGIPNEEVLGTLQELGYTRETLSLLHLVPLIAVGWADGKISDQEREMILEAANMRGVEEGSAAYQQLSDWLQNRPSEEFFDQTLRVIGHLVPGDQESSDVLTQAMQVASASGGILGFGNKVSAEEQALLERIAAALKKDG
jgi:tellurite resistance protein